MPKSYRIRTEVGVDKYINVELDQDFEFLEILSLKILANDVYTRYCSDYGVIVGRVVVNNGYGVPNARVSVFIPLQDEDADNPVIAELYPYVNLTSRNEEGYRYNLLPKDPAYIGHQASGSFPSRGDVLMNDSYVEVYDKYYRFTVKTNESGDFMIFGVPIGEQTVVMDVDLSDIGCFSLSPQDLLQEGIATESQVDGAQFKTSTNLDSLPQIVNLNFNVDVRPLWGDNDICQLGITRVDFDLTKFANIVIRPYAVFMGSILSTTDDDALSIACRPKNDTGNLCELTTGPGQILAIRQTIFSDELGRPTLEQYEFEDKGRIIDDNGAFVASVPMNLNYIVTNEFGDQVFSNDPSKGIPTKGKYRFKFRWINKEKTLSLSRFQKGLQKNSKEIGLSDDEYSGPFQRAGYLVPNIKEHGWFSSNVDPLSLASQTVQYQIPAPPPVLPPYPAQTGPVVFIPVNVGWQFVSALNNISFEIFIDYGTGSGFQPYLGGVESIFLPAGSQIYIVGTPYGANTQDFTFNEIPQQKFDLYRSYAFSLDWDDYVDPQSAIDCDDTFYEFNYNKVYTTALFIDRYKNGIGRAKHLGIKEIDNRTCKTTNNTFPVNDIIKNFDPIFFLFNILINILTPIAVGVLWVLHFAAYSWPILKGTLAGILAFFTGLQIYQAIQGNILIQAGTQQFFQCLQIISPSGPVYDPACFSNALLLIQQGSAQVTQSVITASILGILTILATIFAIFSGPLNINRLGLPMINYPDCTTCECDCGTIEVDGLTPNEILSQINEDVQNSNTSGLAVPAGFLAPVNSSGAYLISHPNYSQNPASATGPNDGFFDCNSSQDFQSFQYLLQNQEIDPAIVTRATQDFIRLFSGYDVLSTTGPIQLLPNEKYLLHAPEPFLFAGRQSSGADERWFAYPLSSTYPQKLNEFNTRDKYFGINAPNRINVTVNPTPTASSFSDQVLVMLANPGTSATLLPGKLFTFQDPNYSDLFSVNRSANLTGASLNDFATNSVTGVTFTGTTGITISYADPNGGGSTNLTVPIIITADSLTQVVSTVNSGPITPGVNGYEQSFLKYHTDLEYFQAITAITVSNFLQIADFTSNQNFFPKEYLLHQIKYLRPGCSIVNGNPSGDFVVETVPTPALQLMNDYQNYEIIICARGVDPNTQKQFIEYDLSRIYGHSTPNTVTVSGSYYMNVPIKGYGPSNVVSNGSHPISHLTTNNQGYNLYFPSYSFSITPQSAFNQNYTGFTSNLPYYYLATDDDTAATANNFTTYNPAPAISFQTNFLSNNMVNVSNGWYGIPFTPLQTFAFTAFPGGAFIGANYDYFNFQNTTQTALQMFDKRTCSGAACGTQIQYSMYYYQPGLNNTALTTLSFLYSAAYYRIYNPSPVNFNSRQYLVMRSDRIPTSTKVENGESALTGYGLHQNNNFFFYDAAGNEPAPQLVMGLDLINGNQFDDPPTITALTETLQCEGMVPLSCYSGNGNSWGVIPYSSCSVPENRVVNGCYCLLNKYDNNYLINTAFYRDYLLLLEWKVRFTMNLALCRGVFAQVFQNNWVNGALYMFGFNTRKVFGIDPNQPLYNTQFYKSYCDDVIVYNDISNNFYYRSSPYSDVVQGFIGKDSPATSGFGNNLLQFPGAAYNVKQIQFPTTVVDLGPRDSFIREICSNPAFGTYYADQIDTTSYQDNSNLLLLSFLSRLLNQAVTQNMQPQGTLINPVEGQSIKQFFDNERRGYRIDGDISQMLSINSEWKVSPFITENLNPATANQYIFFGTEGATGQDPNNPVFGVFFQSTDQELRYRKIMSPGIETYNQSPLIEEIFGYPKSQVVPHYRWLLVQSGNIFGTEDNNWYTDVLNNPGQTGFFQKEYQNLDFFTLGEKYITQYTQSQNGYGFITNFSLNVSPPVPEDSPNFPPAGTSGVIQGQPIGAPDQSTGKAQSIVVGAPYHFYFGLKNGATAVDIFYKLYVPEF
jgi:hypothetical protein